MNRRDFIKGSGAALAAPLLSSSSSAARRRPPNFIVVLTDDLGYGDVGVNGGRMIKTPNLDRMASEGVRLTDFYATANLCTPSRAGLLTGRYPIRTGLAHEVIQPRDTTGLPLQEITLAKALKPAYVSALIGKWHLGHVAPFWPPTNHGFDRFFGLPYSHDMKPLSLFTAGNGVEFTREDVNFARLTERFFDSGVAFIEQNRNRPFFLMLALVAPHVPLDPHPHHAGRSEAAAYGDVVEEVDAQMGRLLARLKKLGLDNDTLIVFTSDNGPWFEGSAGALRDRKGGGAWDGGYRVPFIARQPGVLPPGRFSNAISMNFDLFPTLLAMAGVPTPKGVHLDGRDLRGVLIDQRSSPHEELVFFNNERVAALRTQRWKLVVRSYYRGWDLPISKYGYPLLFDMERDPSETYNLAAKHPEVFKAMMARIERAQGALEPLGVVKEPERLPGPTRPRGEDQTQ